MPNTQAYLEDVDEFSESQKSHVGKLYRLPIAIPDDKLNGPSIPAYFYPDDRLTLMGTGAALDFGVQKKDEILLTIRSPNPFDLEQLDISLPASTVVVSQDLPKQFVKIAGPVILHYFRILSWQPPWSYLSAPDELPLTLIKGRGTCYSRRQQINVGP